MRKQRFLVLFILVLGLTLLTGILPKSASADDSYDVYVKYYFDSKVYHTEIEVKDNSLKAIYTSEDKMSEHWDEYSGWKEEDLETMEKTLSKEEFEELKKTIKDSNFFDLKDVEGVTKEGEEYEAYTLTVTFEGKTKTVEFRYREGGPECPDAFVEIETKLWNFAGLGC